MKDGTERGPRSIKITHIHENRQKYKIKKKDNQTKKRVQKNTAKEQGMSILITKVHDEV